MTRASRIVALVTASAALLATAVTTSPVAFADPRPASPPVACADRQPAPYDTTGFAPGRIGAPWPKITIGRNGNAVVFAAVATTRGGILGFVPLASNGKALVPDFAASSQAKVKPGASLLIDVRRSTLDAYTPGEHVTVTLTRTGQGWQVERMTSIRCIA